jgi:hypothetical protein
LKTAHKDSIVVWYKKKRFLGGIDFQLILLKKQGFTRVVGFGITGYIYEV